MAHINFPSRSRRVEGGRATRLYWCILNLLCATSVFSVVAFFAQVNNHRDTENTEVAQRNPNEVTTQEGDYKMRAQPEKSQSFSAAELVDRAIQRRAIEAVIWGMPAVNGDLMFQAFRNIGGDFNQVCYWSNAAGSVELYFGPAVPESTESIVREDLEPAGR